MHGEGSHAGDVGDLERSSERVEEEAADLAVLPIAVNGETSQDQKRDRVSRHAFRDAFRCTVVTHFTDHARVEADHSVAVERHIGPRCVRLLSLQGVAGEKAIEVRLPASETVNGMAPPQRFDAERLGHCFGVKTDGSLNRRSRRGCRRGGASRAATSVSQWAVSR